MRVYKLDSNPKYIDWEPDLFIVLEVGRKLNLPSYVLEKEVKRVSAIKTLSAKEIPEVAVRLSDLLNSIPLDRKVALILSGALALSSIFFAFQGMHREIAIGQFDPNKGDYNWYLINNNLREFFRSQETV